MVNDNEYWARILGLSFGIAAMIFGPMSIVIYVALYEIGASVPVIIFLLGLMYFLIAMLIQATVFPKRY